ncbi:hypothetical protein V5O48_000136 [Marasmius crinis-equi]|uniref:Yippee domain-containing protein n=1 Tax=Marasmius crinis-equi TaxID=585013 RepID=A0ABR3G243_9AGAR
MAQVIQTYDGHGTYSCFTGRIDQQILLRQRRARLASNGTSWNQKMLLMNTTVLCILQRTSSSEARKKDRYCGHYSIQPAALSSDFFNRTGVHTVADVFCLGCNERLGWYYHRASEYSQKYKEGKYLLEREKLYKDNAWTLDEKYLDRIESEEFSLFWPESYRGSSILSQPGLKPHSSLFGVVNTPHVAFTISAPPTDVLIDISTVSCSTYLSVKMKGRLSLLVALAITTRAFAAKYPLTAVKDGSIEAKYVPNQFIIEMSSTTALNGRSLDRTTLQVHEKVYRALRERDIEFEVKSEYNEPGIIVGAAVVLESPSAAEQIITLPGVTEIRPIVRIPRPQTFNQVIISDANNPNRTSDSFSTHVMTGVDKVHAEGNYGQGISIGIIDTGVDYMHPALGGGFGPGHKFTGGYDFVGDSYTGDNVPTPDTDPRDTCAGHGTHVAGIVGADPVPALGLSGVAYQSKFQAYRVFGCEGGTTDDIIIDALIKGWLDKMDVLTLSLGGSDGWTEGTASVVASRIAESGTVVTIAAGNDGQWGAWYTSSPGNGINVISVASVENVGIPAQNMTVNGASHSPITYLSLYPLPFNGSYPIYATSNDTSKTNDACSPLPDTTPDLSDCVVLIHRGGCNFSQKFSNSANKGGKRFLIYNADNLPVGNIDVGRYQAALIQADDGKWLVGEAQKNPNLTVSFPQTGGATQLPNPNGGLVNDFSSYGPTFDMYMKPALAAPGGDILSTFLGNGYAIESGTSMATPFVAGAAALILKARGKKAGLTVRDRLQMTAAGIPTSNSDENSLLQTVAQQGAGLIQVDKAIHSQTIIEPAQILLNDTTHSRSSQHIAITNTGKKTATYHLRHVAAGTALTIGEASLVDTSNFLDGPVPLTNQTSAVKLEHEQVTVRPGQTVHVGVTIPVPSADSKRAPVYSGYILITGPDGTVKSTYLGAAFSLKGRKVLDDTPETFGIRLPFLLDPFTGDVQTEPRNYTLVGEDVPVIVLRLFMGTARLAIDLVEHDIKFKPTIPEFAKRALLTLHEHESSAGTYEKVKTVGSIAELEYLARNTDGFGFSNGWYVFNGGPTFANGTAIQPGQYRVLVRALKISGHRETEGDYESWLSPIVGVVPASDEP